MTESLTLITFICLGWVHKDVFWESNATSKNAMETSSKSDNSIKIMMDGICRLAPRVDKKGRIMSNGWKIPKDHNLTHIPMQITNFGPLKGIDVESEESNHKEIVKRNAKTVQKRSNGVFACQLGNTIWLMQALEIL